MNKIIKLLSRKNNKEKTNFKNKLKCNDIDFEILLLIINSYLNNQITDYSINNILQDYNYSINNDSETSDELDYEENLKSLLYLENIENLIYLGWLKTDIDFENKNTFNKLNSKITIDKNVFDLLEGNDLNILNIEIKPYVDYYEYLDDNFKLIDFIYEEKINFPKKINKKSPKYKYVVENIKELRKQIKEKLKITIIDLPLEKYKINNNINDDEFNILLIILKETLIKSENFNFNMNEENIIKKVISDNDKIINLTNVLDKFKFNNESIFVFREIFKENIFNFSSKLNKLYFLNKDFLNHILPTNEETKNENEILEIKLNSINKKDNFFDLIKSNKNIKDIVLNDEVTHLINVLKKQNNEEINNRLIEWGVKDVNDDINEKILFFGHSGTGKTLTSLVIANELNKHILTFDCSKIFSMYVGESEKNIKKIFTTYNQIIKEIKNHPILVLNEADQLFSNRIENTDSSSGKHYNNVQNILLEEMEKFKGILICTTNMINSFDKAFSRRFNYKIEFKLPNESERLEIWKNLLPKKAKYEKDFNSELFFENSKILETMSKFKLTGGQIELIIKNTAKKVAIKDDEIIFTYDDFKNEILKETNTDFNQEKIVGFCK